MPIKQAAFKHLRQTKKRAQRNRAEKDKLRSQVKKIRVALEKKNAAEAQALYRAIAKAYDKAAEHRVIKKNAAARKKSRLGKHVNALARAASGTASQKA